METHTFGMRLPRDAAFKRFVHNADFIRHLLRAHPLPDLDEGQIVEMQPASANIVGPDLTQRLTDVAWRLILRDGRLVWLLLECQAEPDPTMPFRMLQAVATMCFNLSCDPPVEHGYTASRVPRVRHLTLYSGRRQWKVAADVSEMIEAEEGGLEADAPRMQCPTLNFRNWPDPGGDGNMAVLLARLQRCTTPEALCEAAEPLGRWAAEPGRADLASAFAAWITQVALHDLGVTDAPVSDNLKEVLDMLQTEPRTWADRMRDEGRLQGREEGREEEHEAGLERERRLLLRMARVRFGRAPLDRLADLLEGITDTDLLEEIGEWLLICDSGDALVSRVRQS